MKYDTDVASYKKTTDFFLFVIFISFLWKHKNTKYIYKYKITQKLVKLNEKKLQN